MINRSTKIYQLLIIVFLFSAIDQVLAQYNIEINNKSSRIVAIRIDGNFKSNLKPGEYVNYSANYNSQINFSLADTDPEVVQAIQSAAYQGTNWKYDWTQFQMHNVNVVGSGIINLVPALHSDGSYTWVTVQVEQRYEEQTSYANTDYDDDDDSDLVWYMVIGLVVGVIIALIPM